MEKSRKNITLQWFVLLLIGSSITFSTLHSHHEIEWNHSTQHTNSDHCLTESTNLCPICGYLFNGAVVKEASQFLLEQLPVNVAYTAESQRLDPFTGKPAGRSPPFAV